MCGFVCAGSNGPSNFGCKGTSNIGLHLTTSNKACKNKCSIAPSKGMLESVSDCVSDISSVMSVWLFGWCGICGVARASDRDGCVIQTTQQKRKCCNPDDPNVKWGNYNSNGWWSKSGYSSDSKEIIVDLPSKHYCFDPSKSYHLWYAEDEHDLNEKDNHGTAKTDVFVRLACPDGTYNPPGKDGCTGTLGESKAPRMLSGVEFYSHHSTSCCNAEYASFCPVCNFSVSYAQSRPPKKPKLVYVHSLAEMLCSLTLTRTANKCTCLNGSPQTGAGCTKNGAAMCKSCKVGWTLKADKTACDGSCAKIRE